MITENALETDTRITSFPRTLRWTLSSFFSVECVTWKTQEHRNDQLPQTASTAAFVTQLIQLNNYTTELAIAGPHVGG